MANGPPANLQLPATKPLNDPGGVWSLQWQLLPMAEALLGVRDESKEICQPKFNDDPDANPQTVNTPSLDGAFVKMSRKALDNWNLVLFQMAHETVRLLNPVVGAAKTLEEGIAFEFSLYVQQFFVDYHGQKIHVWDKTPSYLRALDLVRELPGGAFAAGRSVRQRVGALENTAMPDLEDLFPDVDRTILRKLVERFDRAHQRLKNTTATTTLPNLTQKPTLRCARWCRSEPPAPPRCASRRTTTPPSWG